MTCNLCSRDFVVSLVEVLIAVVDGIFAVTQSLKFTLIVLYVLFYR